MAKVYPEYDYDLADEVISGLQEFAAQRWASLTEQLNDKSEDEKPALVARVLRSYAQDLMKKAIELGNKYKDRTAEVMEAVAARTGIYFPCLPQRYLEICMLAIRPEDKWKINEANPARFVFTVSDCTFRRPLQERYGEELACQEGCLNLLYTLYKELGMKVEVSLNQDLAGGNDGCCFVSVYNGMNRNMFNKTQCPHP